jgi:hypothetical protein
MFGTDISRVPGTGGVFFSSRKKKRNLKSKMHRKVRQNDDDNESVAKDRNGGRFNKVA